MGGFFALALPMVRRLLPITPQPTQRRMPLSPLYLVSAAVGPSTPARTRLPRRPKASSGFAFPIAPPRAPSARRPIRSSTPRRRDGVTVAMVSASASGRPSVVATYAPRRAWRSARRRPSAAPRSTPVDLFYEPGDFGVSSTEWQFDAELKGAAWFGVLVIPHAVMSPLLGGGRLARPFRLARRLAARLAPGRRHRRSERAGSAPSSEPGEAVLRNLSGLVALACGASDEGQDQERDWLWRRSWRGSSGVALGRSRPDARQLRRRPRHLGAPTAPAVRTDRQQFHAIRAASVALEVPRRGHRGDRHWPIGGRHRLWLPFLNTYRTSVSIPTRYLDRFSRVAHGHPNAALQILEKA